MVKSETTTMEKRVKSQALEKFVHNKRAVFGVIVVLVIALCCLLLPLVMDLDPYTTDELAGFNSAPSAEHILGTDDVGRDLFARLLYGGRISLFVGIASTIISVLIGVPLGLLAGYYRGIWETIIMRAADIFMSFPSMILILVLVAVFGPSIMNVTIVIGVLGWTSMAKLIYGNTLSMREKEYIEAARAMGMKNSKIIFSEILPNAIAPVWVSIAFPCVQRYPDRILPELSGPWRSDAAGLLGQHYLRGAEPAGAHSPSMGLDPTGICLILVVIGFNFIGEGVRDALDPKMK